MEFSRKLGRFGGVGGLIESLVLLQKTQECLYWVRSKVCVAQYCVSGRGQKWMPREEYKNKACSGCSLECLLSRQICATQTF